MGTIVACWCWLVRCTIACTYLYAVRVRMLSLCTVVYCSRRWTVVALWAGLFGLLGSQVQGKVVGSSRRPLPLCSVSLPLPGPRCAKSVAFPSSCPVPLRLRLLAPPTALFVLHPACLCCAPRRLSSGRPSCSRLSFASNYFHRLVSPRLAPGNQHIAWLDLTLSASTYLGLLFLLKVLRISAYLHLGNKALPRRFCLPLPCLVCLVYLALPIFLI